MRTLSAPRSCPGSSPTPGAPVSYPTPYMELLHSRFSCIRPRLPLAHRAYTENTAPPDQHQTHLLLSHAILRDTHYSHTAQEAHAVFSDISIARRRERAEALCRARQERQCKKIIDDRLAQLTHDRQAQIAQGALERQGVGSGSDETSMPQPQTDEDLRMALDKAVNRLQEMQCVFKDMEMWHCEETTQRKEESLNIEKLLT
ncbi:hypothetical protein FRC06_004556 [Ceratobasidium sp. 370]|nr:hypothetical protein FRC06_004556 [Ceratobasidium sp. 370]